MGRGELSWTMMHAAAAWKSLSFSDKGFFADYRRRALSLHCRNSSGWEGKYCMQTKFVSWASRSKLIVAVFLASAAALVSVEAAPLPVNNPGFEGFALGLDAFSTHIAIPGAQVLSGDPIPGWVVIGHGGTWRPGPSFYTGGVPEGTNVGWLDYESINSSTLSQVLVDVLTKGTDYTLSVKVGHRSDYPLAQFSVQLLAGGVILAEGTLDKIPRGEFQTVTVTFSAPADHPQLGQALAIRLTANADRQQVNFDDVILDATPSAQRIPR